MKTKKKTANKYDMDEMSYIRNLVEMSLDILNMSTTDILVLALAKCTLDNQEDPDIEYLGVVDEDSALFDESPIIIG
jgi:hypothetical protein